MLLSLPRPPFALEKNACNLTGAHHIIPAAADAAWQSFCCRPRSPLFPGEPGYPPPWHPHTARYSQLLFGRPGCPQTTLLAREIAWWVFQVTLWPPPDCPSSGCGRCPTVVPSCRPASLLFLCGGIVANPLDPKLIAAVCYQGGAAVAFSPPQGPVLFVVGMVATPVPIMQVRSRPLCDLGRCGNLVPTSERG